jgi:diaminopimelate decarboxylase
MTSNDGLSPAARKLLSAAAVLPTPLLLMDLDVVEGKYRALTAALPEARILYAIKANPHPEVLRRLATAALSHHCAASRREAVLDRS